MRRVIAENWTASYGEPIAVQADDPVMLTGRRDSWDGHVWLWARGPDGREGWVPDDLIDGAGRARRAFDAAELSCLAGEALDMLEATHGWVRARDADGRCGWVPERVLVPEAEGVR